MEMHRQRSRVGFKEGFVITWREYVLGCTLGGFKFIATSNRTIDKIFWVFFVLCSVALMSYYSLKLYRTMDEDPITVSMNPEYDTPYREYLPAISICSVGTLSKRKLNDVFKSDRYNNVDRDLIEKALLYLHYPHLAVNETAVGIGYVELKAHNISTEELLAIYHSARPTCSEMIIDIKWGPQAGKGDKYFRRGLFDSGTCCTFNAGLYAVSALGFRPEDVVERHKSIGIGYQNGINMALNSDPEDYFITTASFDGFKAVIHHHDDYPLVHEYGFAVNFGTKTIASIGIIGWTWTDETNYVSLKTRQCYLPGERSLKYFKQYRQSLCVYECMFDAILRNCKCRPPYFLENQTIPFCQPKYEDYRCLQLYSGEHKKEEFQDACKCFPVCERFWYVPELSIAPFSSVGFNVSRTGQRVFATNASWCVKDFGKLSQFSVYFNGEKDQIYIKDLRYNPSILIATVGGLLGFGLGFSFISCIEFLYFLCRGFFSPIRQQSSIGVEDIAPGSGDTT